MKNKNKKSSCLPTALIIAIVFPVLLWLSGVVWSAKYGPRRNIIRQFPTAKIYPQDSPNMGSGGPLQALMPEGYVVPGVRTDVAINGGKDVISFQDLDKLDIGYLNVKGVKITNWEILLEGRINNMYILLTDVEFLGGDPILRSKLENHKIEYPIEGDTVYSFGDAP